jgi:hypothetical protein
MALSDFKSDPKLLTRFLAKPTLKAARFMSGWRWRVD